MPELDSISGLLADLDTLTDIARAGVLSRAEMRLDLGGIGKGFGAAKTIETLADAGFPQALVAVAGDIAAGDAPPGRSGWSVDIERPDGTRESIELAHASISTSGDREQFIERDGVRYSHLLDPRSGIGSTTGPCPRRPRCSR